MKIKTAICQLHPRHVFRIARAQRREVKNVFVQLQADGISGLGEASPNAFYHETADGVAASLAKATAWLRTLHIRSVADLESAWAQAWTHVAPSRAAQCALDLALWDCTRIRLPAASAR